MSLSADTKENASQSQTLNYREGPRKIAVSLCLLGILAGGVIGELLREWMVSASHQHAAFAAFANTPEVRDALAKRGPGSLAANGMVPVNGPWARDLYWQEGRVIYFVLADGSFFFDSARPPVWAIPLVLLCPVLGFLIPWGLMRILSRMGVEYFAKKPAPASRTS